MHGQIMRASRELLCRQDDGVLDIWGRRDKESLQGLRQYQRSASDVARVKLVGSNVGSPFRGRRCLFC